jgi:O-antigen/teichoic acid export membrane protein
MTSDATAQGSGGPPPRRPARILRNALSNYAYVLVMGLALLAFTPIYVRTLGASEWGLVALCMTLQAFFQLLDLGMSQVMPREVAQNTSGARRVFRIFLAVYGGLAVLVGVGGQFLAGSVAHGLGTPDTASDLEQAFRLVMLQFMFQFTNNAAIGYWNGLEQQHRANVRLALFGLTKHCGALAAVTLVEPSVLAYMIPFAAVAAVECTTNLGKVWRTPATASASLQAAEGAGRTTTQMLRSAAGFSGAVLVGMLTTQIDRLYLARSVPTEAFGAYVVAVNLALAMMQLVSPLQRAFTPRVMAGGAEGRRALRRLLKMMLLVAVLPCLLLAAFAEPLFKLWLSNPAVAETGYPAFRWIVVAVAMNAVYSIAYLELLRSNRFTTVTALNLMILGSQVVFLWAIGSSLGLLAGAGTWLVCGAIQLAFALWLWGTTRRSAEGQRP